MIPLLVIQQRNLMRRALRLLDGIEVIKSSFNAEDTLISLKIEEIQEDYAHTMTQLIKLMMQNTPS